MAKPKEVVYPKVAVIGLGFWGKNLVRNFYELGSLKIICDSDEVALNAYSQKYPEVETFLNFLDVVTRNDIQGIVIATPAETHYRIARESILAGKNVFIEKPMVLKEDEGLELIRLNKHTKKTLMVGHLLQYHPAFIRIKQLTEDGTLGRINYIYSHRLNLGKIRREENILWSFAPHDISMILSIAGEKPESLRTTGANYLHNHIADVTTTHLKFPSGLCAHIFVSWLHPFKEQKLVVVGDKKMAVFDDTKEWKDKLLLYPHSIKWKNQIPIPWKAEAERQIIVEQEPLRVECEHFLKSMQNGHKVITNGYEGLRVLKVLNASQRSLDHDGEEVDLRRHSTVVKKNKVEMKDHIKDDYSDSIEKKYFSHPTVIIDSGCRIGENTKIWHYSHILSGSVIGRQCNLGQNVVIGPDVQIGAYCKIQNNVGIYKGVTLKDGVFCGPSMVFTNVYNPRAKIKRMDQIRPTLVSEGATLGANCTIVCGINIGKYAFIGAGAVVNRSVPDHALVVGNPGRQIGWVCRCGQRLNDQLKCFECSLSYEKISIKDEKGVSLILQEPETNEDKNSMEERASSSVVE